VSVTGGLNVPHWYRGRQMLRDVGECIYCGRKPPEAKLRREHIIPFSLGSDIYLKNASYTECAKITRDIEQHVARNVYGHMRVHTGIQTRNPQDRPSKLPIRVIRLGVESRLELPINDHPFFLILPVWRIPGILRRADPLSNMFEGLRWNAYYYIPDNARDTFDMKDGESVRLAPEWRVDAAIFARVLTKIAYCQCVALFGVEGFDHPVAPRLILGKFKSIPYLVGTDPRGNDAAGQPSARAERGIQHIVSPMDINVSPHRRLLMVEIRLFADSGTDEHGMPTYAVVVGEPNSLTTAPEEWPLLG
jgi:hypothetical protein